MFGFGVLLAGEEEGADRDEAALAVGEVSPFRSKIEDRPTLGPDGGKLKFIWTSSIMSPAARMTGPISLILISSAWGRSSSVCCVGISSSNACIIWQYSTQRTCCS